MPETDETPTDERLVRLMLDGRPVDVDETELRQFLIAEGVTRRLDQRTRPDLDFLRGMLDSDDLAGDFADFVECEYDGNAALAYAAFDEWMCHHPLE